MRAHKIPQTDSIQELTRFWDTHDLTDFEDQLEEANERVFQRTTSVTIRLSREEAETIKKIARSKRMRSPELIRQRIAEKAHAS
ncbi:MAG: hypothetical protein FJ279_25355 [Planctomycetes bacterium]|nr:hypothetical protein [Planctomycetota bacterium]